MSQFRNLVFEGGGVKGIAYAGAIEALDGKGILADIRRVAGTSAGAITAAILALGADGAAVREIIGSTSFRKFLDDSWGWVRDVKRLLDQYGWYKGDSFAFWLQRQIQSLCGDRDLTFKRLQALAAAEPGKYRELFVVGTNLSTQLEEVFSAEQSPDMPIWQAVRISMSIPLFFTAVRSSGATDQLHVDGGITWNYPIDLFDDEMFHPAPETCEPVRYTKYGPGHVYNKETLGFRVDTRDEIKAEIEGWKRPPLQIDNLMDYSKALIGYVFDMLGKLHLHKNDWHRTVFIDADGVRTTQFDLTDAQVANLVANGRKGVEEYFQWFDNPKEEVLNRVRAAEDSSRRRPK